MLRDEWERSGGSAAQFADYVGIRYSAFANWIQNGEDKLALAGGGNFIPAESRSTQRSSWRFSQDRFREDLDASSSSSI